jgi:hypothetical protein
MNWRSVRWPPKWDTIVAIITVIVIAGAILYIWLGSTFRSERQIQAELTMAVGTLALAVGTAVYARYTRSLAEEMRAQRYDTVRPVIDIQIVDVQKQVENQTSETLSARGADTHYKLSFALQNIGLGPAIGVCSTTPTPAGFQWRWDWDTLAAGARTRVLNLSLEQKEGLLTLAVFYTDVYGRGFDSGRQINIEKQKKDWKIGPLLISPPKEKKA